VSVRRDVVSLLGFVQQLPGGRPAVARLKLAARRAQNTSRQVLGLRDWRRRTPPVAWTRSRTEPPVVPDVPVDISTMSVYRTERFPRSGPAPWLDRPEARSLIRQREERGEISAWEGMLARKWAHDGYVIVRNLIEADVLDHVWACYEESIRQGVVTPDIEPHFPGDPVPGRLLDPHLAIPEIAELMHHPDLVHVVELLLGAETIPFQSISGHKASQQAIHGDSIHMTTYPEGYLVALWIAFEDIEPGSGPLEYYPGSHRLPTIYSSAVGIPESAMRESGYAQFAAKYTPTIRDVLTTRAFRPAHFHARKGDVLFWHANLLHGGSVRTDFTRSRKALVFHYFAKGCVCYHDLNGNLSRVHDPVGR
jgi:hypothetical protein